MICHSEKIRHTSHAPLDFRKLSPVAVTLDKLLRHCHGTALHEGEAPGLTYEILSDLVSSDNRVKTARWRQLRERLGGLNSTLVANFELLANEARLADKDITMPVVQMAV